MYSMQVNVNLEKLYCTVRESTDIKLGYNNPDYETFQETGRARLERGEVYILERVSGFQEVYALATEAGVYRAKLTTLLADSNMIIFPIKEVLEEFVSSQNKMFWNA